MLLFSGSSNYYLPHKIGNSNLGVLFSYSRLQAQRKQASANATMALSTIKSLFLTKSYSTHNPSKITSLDKSLSVVKTLKNEQAQIVLNKMYEYSSGDLRIFLEANVKHLLNPKYLVESKFFADSALKDISEVKSVKDSVALGFLKLKCIF